MTKLDKLTPRYLARLHTSSRMRARHGPGSARADRGGREESQQCDSGFDSSALKHAARVCDRQRTCRGNPKMNITDSSPSATPGHTRRDTPSTK